MDNERESFNVEVEPNAPPSKSGYYFKKRTIALVVIGAVLVIVLVGIIAAFLGPARHGKYSMQLATNFALKLVGNFACRFRQVINKAFFINPRLKSERQEVTGKNLRQS